MLPENARRACRTALAATCTLSLAIPASADGRGASDAGSPNGAASASAFGGNQLLDSHNAERLRLGLPPLVWNTRLASDAENFATELAARGELRHSKNAGSGHGENLWMGTSGAWDPAGMVEMFLEERRYFRSGAFPDVSLTGNWVDVGHYAQIVWRDTKEVGCATKTAKGMDILVCRYFPAGNVTGKAPF